MPNTNNGNHRSITYADGILEAFNYLLSKFENVFVIGQGLWSPWYVGNTMNNLAEKFGKNRIIDTPVSELGCTGAAIGASLCGYRPIVVHPRMDFMILAADQIVNQAAKWSYMLGGQSSAAVTIRSIINRGGEQGAQHSQALHSWFSHIPGLRVVMPATPQDARDLLISSVLSNDPVLYIDDRWLYQRTEVYSPIIEKPIESIGPVVRLKGSDITLVGAGYAEYLCESASELLALEGISAEVIDVRTLNPFDVTTIINSVKRTGRLVAVDIGWSNSGFASEIISSVVEKINISDLKALPQRVTLKDTPAPTSKPLEDLYYKKPQDVVVTVKDIMNQSSLF